MAAFFVAVSESSTVDGHVLHGGRRVLHGEWPRVLRGGHVQRVGPGEDFLEATSFVVGGRVLYGGARVFHGGCMATSFAVGGRVFFVVVTPSESVPDETSRQTKPTQYLRPPRRSAGHAKN